MEFLTKHHIHEKALINGEFVGAESKKTFQVLNPATEEVLAQVPDMDDSDTAIAIKSAHNAFQTWKNTTAKVENSQSN